MPGIPIVTGREAATEPRPRWRIRLLAAALVLVAGLTFVGGAAAGVEETGGYPWPNAKPGDEDDVGLPAGECESYVNWKLRQQGIPAERASQTAPRIARAHFETVDRVPAAGSVMSYIRKPPGHVAYVESVDFEAGTMVISDYNGLGGPLRYGIGTIPIPDAATMARLQMYFIHVELPAVAGGKFVNVNQYGPKRTLSNRTGFAENRFVMSPNKRYVFLLDDEGGIAVYDRERNFEPKWQVRVKRNAELNMFILDNRPKARLVLEEEKSWKRVRSWYVGAARKIQLNNAGGLSGIRGGKVVWRAASLRQIPKVARAAEGRMRRVRSAS